jgi:DNA uptake protein ComE-like DNA-binding protein/prefoldin subunit 5
MSKKKPPMVIDVNTALAVDLVGVPNMNAALAEQITENKPYQRYEDLLKIKGMGPVLLEKFRPYLKISPIDVNSATVEELAVLPRLSRSIAEKIILGRPYADLEEIRAVKGMGARSLELLKPYLLIGRFEGNLLPSVEMHSDNKKAEKQEEFNKPNLTEMQAEPGPASQTPDKEQLEQPLIAVGSTMGTQSVILPSEKQAEEESPVLEKQSFSSNVPNSEQSHPPVSASPEKKPWTTRAIQIIAPEADFHPHQVDSPRYLTRSDMISWGVGIGVLVMILSVVIALSILAIANGGLRFGSLQQVSNLNEDLQAIQTQAQVLGQDVEGLRTRVDSLDTLSGRIITLESKVDALNVNVQDLTSQINTFQTQIDSINSEITLIQENNQRFEQFLNGLNQLMGQLFNGAP